MQFSEHHTAPLPGVQWHSLKVFLWGIVPNLRHLPIGRKWLLFIKSCLFSFLSRNKQTICLKEILIPPGHHAPIFWLCHCGCGGNLPLGILRSCGIVMTRGFYQSCSCNGIHGHEAQLEFSSIQCTVQIGYTSSILSTQR